MRKGRNKDRAHFFGRKLLCLAVLMVLMGNAFPVTAGAAGTQEPEQLTRGQSEEPLQGWIYTSLTAAGRKVTLTVNLAEDSQATSGRIKIYYPEELLKCVETEEGKLFALEDTNTKCKEEGKKGIAYAWADTRKQAQGGSLLTVTWEAQEGADGQEIAVETDISELFSQETALTVKKNQIIDRVKLDFGTTASAPSGGTVSGVRTGDDSSIAGYVLLGLGAVLVLAELGRKKLQA